MTVINGQLMYINGYSGLRKPLLSGVKTLLLLITGVQRRTLGVEYCLGWMKFPVITRCLMAQISAFLLLSKTGIL